MEVRMEKDDYGNCRWLCLETTTFDTIQLLVQDASAKTADIIVGCSKDVAQRLEAYYVGKNANGQDVYVKRNQASCPYIHQGKVRSAGVGLYAIHEGQRYTILHKDKFRNVCFAMGGTWEPNEVREEDVVSIARREVREESSGKVQVGSDVCELSGVELKDMESVAEVHFSSKFFGVDGIEDRYMRFASNLSTSDPFHKVMFHKANVVEDGSYILKYIDHPETDYLWAVPHLCTMKTTSIPALIDDIVQKKKHRNISTLAIFLDVIYLRRDVYRGDWVPEKPNAALPPTLRRIRFMQEPESKQVKVKAAKKQTIGVFHESGFKLEQHDDVSLQLLQEYVQGTVTRLDSANKEVKFQLYLNEKGLCDEDTLKPNDLAEDVLQDFDFITTVLKSVGDEYQKHSCRGTVVCARTNKAGDIVGLRKEDCIALQHAVEDSIARQNES